MEFEVPEKYRTKRSKCFPCCTHICSEGYGVVRGRVQNLLRSLLVPQATAVPAIVEERNRAPPFNKGALLPFVGWTIWLLSLAALVTVKAGAAVRLSMQIDLFGERALANIAARMLYSKLHRLFTRCKSSWRPAQSFCTACRSASA